ncbi:MAG: hypothetical protein ABJE47_05180 [bacterium]
MTDHTDGVNLDFGDDDDEVPHVDDPQFDAWLLGQAPALNSPPVTPRLAMWDAIQAAQLASADASAGRITDVRPLRRVRWFLPAAVAAALLLGIGIDRYSFSRPGQPLAKVAKAPTPSGQNANDPNKLYRLAAVQTLSQAEALLTAYRATGTSAQNAAATLQLGIWGRQVLNSTRLLMDSPAGDDPQLRALLNDLELVLAQIIRLSGAPPDTTDRQLIDRAMRDRDLLPRIQTAVPAGIAGSASDE